MTKCHSSNWDSGFGGRDGVLEGGVLGRTAEF